MQAQLVLMAVLFGASVIAAVLMAVGYLPGPAKAVDAWSAARPTLPRRWLEAAFWGSMTLSIACCGLIVGTVGGALPAVWNDVGQLLIWLVIGVDAVISRRRMWLVVTAIAMVFSGYQVAVQL